MAKDVIASRVTRRFAAAALALAAALITGVEVRAQFVLNETFSHTTFDQSGWVVNAWDDPNNPNPNRYRPTLTASLPTNQGGDASGSGWLRMANNLGQEATYARLTTPIPSANNNITVDLKFQMWKPEATTGADGFTISLRDASVPFDVGAFGGSLGYAQKNKTIDPNTDQTHAGMAGGYFSVGVDAYGNFSSPTEGRVGGPAQTADAVAVRGPGSGSGQTYQYVDANGNLVTASNYAYLTGTQNLTNSLGSLNFTGAATRPVDTNASAFREVVFNLNTANILTVSLRYGATGTLTQVLQYDMTLLGIRPENLELVFTAGTGGSYQYIDLQGLSIVTTGAPVGTIFFSNYSGDNSWGTGNNWGNATSSHIGTIPAATANLVFSNHVFTDDGFQLKSAQNVDLGANRTAGSIQFDAPFNFTLQGYTLTLDSGQTNTPTAITVTSAAPGGAHSITSGLVLNSDLNVNTNTGTALNIVGSLAAGNHSITLNNNGTTTISGQITGTGPLTQTSGSIGSTVISGDSSSTFTGAVTVESGTIRLGNSNVLNASTALSLSTANSFGTFDLANNNQTIGNITFVSGGLIQTGTGTLTLNGNVTSQASATTATITGNLNLGSLSRTFTVADGGVTPDMAIAANVSGTGGLIKNGNGSLTLSGANTYSGGTMVSAGTVIAASNTALGSGTAAVSPSATLALQGGINLTSGNITVSGNGFTNTNGAIDNRSGNNTVSSNVVLAGTTIVGAANGTQLTIAGNIGQSTASGITTGGLGTIVLTGNNSYSGATTVSGNTTLVAASNNALGTNVGGTTVANNGTLGFQGNVNYTTTESVSVVGAGAAGRNGAIDNIAGNNSFAGNISLAGATQVGAAAASNLTLAGTVSGTANLTVGGNGTITLAGANTYTGATTVNAGATLIAANNNALGNAAGTTTVGAGGTLGLQNNVTVSVGTLNVNGNGVGGTGALTSVSGANTISTQVTLAGNSALGAAAGSTLRLAGGLTDGASTFGITKVDTGTVVLAAATNYNGTTNITAGTLSLAGNGTIAGGGAITVSNGTLTLDNTGTVLSSRVGAASSISLNDGTIRFLGSSTATTSDSLGTVTASTGGSTIFVQSGATTRTDLTIGSLLQNGSSTITFATDATATLGAGNTSAGVAGSPRVFLSAVAGAAPGGSLTSPVSLPGWILVSDSTGTSNFAEYTGSSGTGNGVRALSSYYTGALGININDPTKSVLLTSTSPAGAYTLTNANTTTDGNLKITDAPSVILGNQSSQILQLGSGGLLKSGATATTITGAGQLTTSSFGTLAVTVDNANGSLGIGAVIADNINKNKTEAINVSKSGAGLLALSGTNTFTGNVTINDGTLRINGEAALGSVSAIKTITLNGGILNVSSGFTANAAKTWSVGANNTGTLDIDAAQTLSIVGAGDLISTSTSQLVKAGAGTLVIAAANTGFLGNTTVNAGTLELRSANALGTNRPLTLNGGTLALRSDGNTTFANNITVTANSTIDVNRLSTGSNFTLAAGSLAIGSSTLTTTGGNFYDMKLGNVTVTGSAVLNPTTADLFVGTISGTGSITKSGAANLTFTAASSYSGATTVNAGTLFTQGTNFLPTTTALTIGDGATVNTGGFSQTLGSLAGGTTTGTAVLDLGAGALTVGDSATTTFSGNITASSFTKNGSGQLTLGGAVTNAVGSFALNDGTIVAAKTAGDATGTGNVTIGDGAGAANSAVLRLNAANQINNASAVSINADGRLDLNGNSETIASLSGAGSVNLGAGTLTLSGNASTVYSGSIGGAGGLVKGGTGTLTLSGNNNYSGSTNVAAGTLRITTSAALGTGVGGVTVANNASLELTSNINVTGAALSINGSGLSGTGALRNVSGDNTWAGQVNLGGNSTIAVSAGNLYLQGGINNAGNTLTVDGSGNTQAVGAITGAGAIIKKGIGALVLTSANNTYTGPTTVQEGSLQINANGAGPASSAVSLAASGATLNVNNYTASIGSLDGVAGTNVTLGSGSLTAGGTNASTSYAGTISGTGSFTKTGTGTFTVAGAAANTLSGSFNVADGTVLLSKSAGVDATGTGTLTVGDGSGVAGSAIVQLNAANQINDASAVTVNADGRLNLNGNSERIGSLAGSGNVVLGTGTLTTGANNSSRTFSGGISGTGGLVKEGTGNLTLTGTNTFTGGTVVNGGTLTLGASNTLASTGTLTIASGAGVTLAGGVSQTVAGLSTTATSTLNTGSTTSVLTVTGAGPTTLTGNLTGNGTLAFTGNGNLTLASGLNFTGTLSLSGGTVYLNGNVNLSGLTITGNTVLDFGNSAATTLNLSTLNITNNAQVSVINWVHLSDFFYTQNFNLINTSTNTTTPATPDVRGTAPANQINFGGWQTGSTVWQSMDKQITPAPEPATYGALFIGATLGCFGFYRWRRRERR